MQPHTHVPGPEIVKTPECPGFIVEAFAKAISDKFIRNGNFYTGNQDQLDKFTGTEILNWRCAKIEYVNGRINVVLEPMTMNVDIHFSTQYPKKK